MNNEEWEKLSKENYPEYCKRYSEFMYDEGNELNCSHCPKVQRVGMSPAELLGDSTLPPRVSVTI